MMRDGWEIDAHTLTHPDLTTVDAARLRREVAGLSPLAARAFGVPVDFFAYPAGRYNPTSRRRSTPRATGRDHHPAGPGHRAGPTPMRCRGSASRPR